MRRHTAMFCRALTSGVIGKAEDLLKASGKCELF
jgi:hypothetical protein